MKLRLTLAVFALVAVTFCAAPAAAQMATPQHVATIPFEFRVGDAQLPAGQYAISQYGNLLQVRPLMGGKAATATTVHFAANQATNVSHLKFERRGDGLILSTVFFAGQEEGIELLTPKIRAASRM